jgi:hypothetical protein
MRDEDTSQTEIKARTGAPQSFIGASVFFRLTIAGLCLALLWLCVLWAMK